MCLVSTKHFLHVFAAICLLSWRKLILAIYISWHTHGYMCTQILLLLITQRNWKIESFNSYICWSLPIERWLLQVFFFCSTVHQFNFLFSSSVVCVFYAVCPLRLCLSRLSTAKIHYSNIRLIKIDQNDFQCSNFCYLVECTRIDFCFLFPRNNPFVCSRLWIYTKYL